MTENEHLTRKELKHKDIDGLVQNESTKEDNADMKNSQNEHTMNLEKERLHMTNILSRGAWMSDELKEEETGVILLY